MEEWNKEASELFLIFINESRIKKYSEKLLEIFIARYYLLKLGWAVEDLLIIFTEICLLILLWGSEFTQNMTLWFKILFTLSIHTVLSYPRRLKGYKHGQDAARVLTAICDIHTNLYELEEEKPDGES